MDILKQKFWPPLDICLNKCGESCFVSERFWVSENKTEGLNLSDDMRDEVKYIGSFQIAEVWKHYYKEYYISNYGYIVKIREEDKEKAEKIIPEKLKSADETSMGYPWIDFSNELKDLFRKNAFIPFNRQGSGCQVCLNLTGKSAEYDVHKLVARFFLEKPKDFDKKSYVVHHIDNNSYNNNVTNLIYLTADTHQRNQHKIYHPMSHK